MLFNSIDFAWFLPLVFLLYWFVTQKNLKVQNALIVIASYVFYGWWDWRFTSLILFSTLVDYTVGVKLGHETKSKNRKILLWISIIVNLGFLGFFKYYNFFAEQWVEAFSFLGMRMQVSSLNIILPVGISFYTFQTLSYSIDVYKGKLKPTQDFIAFAAFVSFFPQLVAGPIERATHLLPQFYQRRVFNYSLAVDGLRQILWGLFKKVVIADRCAEFANEFFNHSESYNGSSLVLGALFFTFQIYGDFSGYSDIAIGTSRLFGFDLKQNFKFPYFSRDIAEFWRNWHISLSTWFRDYLYIPLGGSQEGKSKTLRNTFIIFIVSGFWHGANWTFIIWGGLNALYFLPLYLAEKNRRFTGVVGGDSLFPTLKQMAMMLKTFMLTVFAWIFFRADNVGHAFSILSTIFSKTLFSVPQIDNVGNFKVITLLLLFFLAIEWLGRSKRHALEAFGLQWSRPWRWLFYAVLIFALGMYAPTEESPFIYFQF